MKEITAIFLCILLLSSIFVTNAVSPIHASEINIDDNSKRLTKYAKFTMTQQNSLTIVQYVDVPESLVLQGSEFELFDENSKNIVVSNDLAIFDTDGNGIGDRISFPNKRDSKLSLIANITDTTQLDISKKLQHMKNKIDGDFYDKTLLMLNKKATGSLQKYLQDQRNTTKSDSSYYDILMLVPRDVDGKSDFYKNALQKTLVDKHRAKNVYVSQHLDFVTASIPVEEIPGLTDSSYVAQIGDGEILLGFELNISKQVVGATPQELIVGTKTYNGNGIKVAVIDGGIRQGHQDLPTPQKIIKQITCNTPNALLGDYTVVCNDVDVADSSNHGTHVASIIAGLGAEDSSMSGIASGSILLNAKYGAGIDADSELNGSSAVFARLIDWSIQNGARVINMSLGVPTLTSCTVDTEIDGLPTNVLNSIVDEAVDEGIIIIKSAGNIGDYVAGSRTNIFQVYNSITNPGCAFNVIAVGNMNDGNNFPLQNPDLHPSSSAGPTPDGRLKPEIVAPGTLIRSLDRCNINNSNYNDFDFYSDTFVDNNNDNVDDDDGQPDNCAIDNENLEISGTSFSAPQVSGAAAIILQAYPQYTPLETKVALLLGADWVPNHQPTLPLTANIYENSPTHMMNRWGFGLLNTSKSLHYANTNHIMRDYINSGLDQKTFTFTANSGERVKVVLSWLRHPQLLGYAITNETVDLPIKIPPSNLTLTVTGPGGFIQKSESKNQNNEFVVFTAPNLGANPATYTATVSVGGLLSQLANVETFVIGSSHSLQKASQSNSLPSVVVQQPVYVKPGVPFPITLTGSDADGDGVTFKIKTFPAKGTLGAVTQFSNPRSALVTFTPNADFAGLDSFVVEPYDGKNLGPAYAVSINRESSTGVETTGQQPTSIQTLNPLDGPESLSFNSPSSGSSSGIWVESVKTEGAVLQFNYGAGTLYKYVPPNSNKLFLFSTPQQISDVKVTKHAASTGASVSLGYSTQSTSDQPPVANAGSDQVVLENDIVILDGSGSFDPDGTILLYTWQQLSGPPITLNSINSQVTSFTAPEVSSISTVTIQLTVKDANLQPTTDIVSITINDNSQQQNQPPVSNAGSDQTVNEGSQVALNGATSSDPDGNPITYQWEQTSGPSVTLSDTTTPNPTFTSPQVTVNMALDFRLTVRDSLNAPSQPDYVTITVNDIPPGNSPPTANAGPDQFVDEISTIYLDGRNSSDPNFDSLTFSWSQVAGTAITLSNPVSATPTFVAPSVTSDMILSFQLIVNDGQVNSTPDTINITVEDDPTPPGTTSITNPDQGLDDDFGKSVATIGNHVLIGVPRDDSGGFSDAGSVYLFDGTTNGQLLFIPNPQPENSDNFGASVAAFTVGTNERLVVGAPNNNLGGTGVGTAYVFDGATGSLLLTLTNPDPTAFDHFGRSVAILGTDKIVIGTPDDDPGGIGGAGSVYVFDGVTGSLVLTVPNPNLDGLSSSDDFGTTVATVGNRIIVGTPDDDTGASNSGAVHVINGTTGQPLLFIPNPVPQSGDDFGEASVAGIGTDKIIVGVSDHTLSGLTLAGSVFVFDATSGTLIYNIPNPQPAASDEFGKSVSSAAGANILIGAPGDDTDGTDVGLAYLYSGTTGALIQTVHNPDIDTSDRFGAFVTSFGDSILVVSAPTDVGPDNTGGATGTVYLIEASIPPNNPPIANAGQDQTLNEGSQVTLNGTASFDPDGNPISFSWTQTVGPAVTLTNVIAPTLAFVAPAVSANTLLTFQLITNDGSLNSQPDTINITVLPVNDPPSALGDVISTSEDTPIVVSVLQNDFDPDGDPLFTTSASNPQNGNAFVNLNGTITYAPNLNYNGNDIFNYTISDGNGGTDSASVTVTVTPVNDPPLAVSDSAVTQKNTLVNISVLSNDSDPDGDTLSITNVSSPSNGTATVTGNNTITYTPNTNFVGNDSFAYTISDVNGGTAITIVQVTVSAPPNSSPIAVNDSATISEDNQIVLNVLANDSDPDNDPLTIISVTVPTNGTAVINANQTITYTPNLNYNGNDSFVYTISDGTFNATAAVSITVMPVNDTPVATDDIYSTPEETTLNVAAPGILANDSDIETPISSLSFTLLNSTVSGILTLNANGSFNYIPDANFAGTDSFSYQLFDESQSDVGTVTITVTPVNDPPILNPIQSQIMDELTPLEFIANATDVDGQPLTYGLSGAPAGATINATTGVFTWTPTESQGPGGYGFTISVTDGISSDFESALVTVNEVNTAPVLDPIGPKSVDEEATLFFDANATDSDIPIQSFSFGLEGAPTNATINATTGQFSWTPLIPGSYIFNVTVSDGATSDFETIAVTVNDINHTPIANPQTVSTNEDTAKLVTLTGSDQDGDTITFSITSFPASGILAGLNSTTGEINYIPNANFNGNDIFAFKVNDGLVDSAPVTVTITVLPVNDTPTASDDSLTTQEDVLLSVDSSLLLSNDSDIDGNTLTITSAQNPQNGVVSLTNSTLTFIPNPNFNGQASFGYTVSDGSLTDDALVTITITSVNDSPVAVNDSATTPEDNLININVLGNDSDPEGDLLSITLMSTPPNGAAVITNGTITYTPNLNYNGNDSFNYTISDGNGGTGTATVLVTISPVNDSPVALADSTSTQEDAPVLINVLSNDSDADNESLNITSMSGPANGTVTINANQTITYLPTSNFFGSDAFSYTISDPNNATSTVNVSITITSVNDAPIAVGDSASISEDTILSIDSLTLVTNDLDSDGDTLSLVSVQNPANGTISFQNSTITFTPNANYHGSASFEYVVSDGTLTDTGIVAITVTSINDVPVSDNQSVTAPEDTAIPITLFASDIDGDALTYVITASPLNGNLTGTAPNLTYTPNPNFNGADSFTFKANDGSSDSNTSTVSITTTSVNDAPAANNDSATIPEDTQLLITVSSLLANDSDADGDALSINSVQDVTNGAVTLANNTITFNPNLNFNGQASFIYVVADAQNSTDTAQVSITVTPVNDVPVLEPITPQTINELTALTFTAIASDIDEDTVSYILTGAPTGAAINATTGAFIWTPSESQGPGTYAFEVHATDGSADVFVTVDVTVNEVNTTPVATDGSVSTNEDTQVSVQLAATDADGNPLTFYIVTQPANGILSGVAPNMTYSPNPNFNGADSLTFNASDSLTTSNNATITITVNSINDAPVAAGDATSTNEDMQLQIQSSILLSNDADADGDDLSIISAQNPINGTVSFANNTVTFVPNADFNGLSSFEYVLSDGTLTDTALVSITVNSVNDAPTANGQSITTAEDTPYEIILGGSDVDGDSLAFTILAQPTNGTLSGTAPNITYTPNANYEGADIFTFKINDGTVDSNIATISITITSVNDTPVANSDSKTTPEDTSAIIDVLSNDNDVDGDTLAVISIVQPSNGFAVNNGNGTVAYTPNLNYNGNDSFAYVIFDGHGANATATVAITITPINDSPVSTNDSFTTPEDTQLSIDASSLLENDSDPDGDSLSVISVQNPINGTVILTNNTIAYTPSQNLHGTGSFQYTTSDGSLTVTALVIITIPSVNDMPLANDQSISTNEDESKPITLTGSDPDGDALAFTILTQPNGTLSGTAPNLTYVPNSNFNGNDSFTFKTNDGLANSTVATVSITLSPVNDSPIANDDSVATLEDQPITISVLTNDSDPDGDALSLVSTQNATNGVATIANNTITFTPNANFNGQTSFEYVISDGSLTDSALVTVTVNSVNDAPVLGTIGPKTMDELTTLSFTATATDVDIPVQSLSFSLSSAPSGASINGTSGLFTFTPTESQQGIITFDIIVSDGSLTDSETITVTVNEVNVAPITNSQAFTINEDMSKSLKLNATDADIPTQSLAFTVLTQPIHGTLFGTTPNLTYTPSTNYNGEDYFTFKANDSISSTIYDSYAGGFSPTITIDGFCGDYGGNTKFQRSGVIVTLDNQVVKGTLKFSAFTSNSGGQPSGTWKAVVIKGPFSGSYDASKILEETAPFSAVGAYNVFSDRTVTLQGNYPPLSEPVAVIIERVDSTGSRVAQNNPDGVPDGSKIGTLCDGTWDATANRNFYMQIPVEKAVLDSNTSTISVTILPVNDAPDALSQSITVQEDIPKQLALNATDADGNTLTFTILAQPTYGTLTGTAPNLTYTPNTNYNGADSFTFKVNDGIADSDPSTISIAVTSINDAPVASDDMVSTNEDSQLQIPSSMLLSNDSDVDGDTLSILSAQNPINGTVSFANNTITFVPNANFNGQASFEYAIFDGVLTDNALVTVAVAPINDAPIADSQQVTTNEEVVRTIVLNATDLDGDSLHFTVLTQPINGTLLGTSPNVTYIPNTNFNGNDTFTFQASDNQTDSDIATISITVTPVNDAPTVDAGNNSTVIEGVAVGLLGSGFDVDGAPLTFSWAQTSGPAVTLNNAITASPTFVAPTVSSDTILTFELTVSDGDLFATDTVNVTVLNSVTITAIATGSWVNPATWNSTVPLSIQPHVTVLIPANTAVTIPVNVTVTNSGTINNSGTILNSQGTILNFGVITNSGTIENNSGILANSGTITNNAGKSIHNNSGTITNEQTGTMNNSGTIENNFTTITNNGILNNNAGSFITNNSGGTLTNSGTINNAGTMEANPNAVITNNQNGTIYNNVGGVISNNESTAKLYNSGTISNNGQLNNYYGKLDNSGTITNYGTILSDGLREGTPEILYVTFVNNNATLNNYGTITIEASTLNNNLLGGINNYGTLNYNSGTLNNNLGSIITNNQNATINNNYSSTINNYAIVNNFGNVENNDSSKIDNKQNAILTNNAGGLINNNNGGTIITNSGTLNNSASATINNSGSIINNAAATINNDGAINIICTSVFNNNGVLTGNAVANVCNYDGVVAYRSDTGINAGTSPKVKLWVDSTQTYTSEIELPSSGSNIQNIQIKVFPTSDKIVLVSQSQDGKLDGYVCMTNCQNASSWTVTNDIGQISSVSTTQKRFDIEFENTGDAILVYGVLSTDITKDLAYKVLPTATTSFAGISEQYINDDSANGGSDLQYTWIALDRDADVNSEEIALIGFDSSGSDVNAWIWSGSTWSNRVEITASATATNGGNAIAVQYASDGSKAMIMSGDGTSGNVITRYWDGTAWSSAVSFDVDAGDQNDAKWITLKADPVTDDLQAVIVDSGSDLATSYWSGTTFVVTSNIDTAVDTVASRAADFAWNPAGSTGKIVWDTDTTASTLSQRTCSPQCTSSTTTFSVYTGNGAWLTLFTNPVDSNPVNILGIRLNSAFDAGSFGWNGSTFTNYGDQAISWNSGATSSEVYSVDFK